MSLSTIVENAIRSKPEPASSDYMIRCRLTVQAGLLVRRVVRPLLAHAAAWSQVTCQIEEVKGLLTSCFLVVVQGDESSVRRFAEYLDDVESKVQGMTIQG